MDLTVTGLRVLREVAERGTFTAAAAALGYTQSAVSRQVAVLERAAGGALFERRRDGVRLTPAGLALLGHAGVALDALDAAERELRGLAASGGVVRLGMFISAGAVLVPRALATLRRSRPDIAVTTREGTTPALVRSLRAGTLDLAVLSSRPPFRPPDDETPRLELATLVESTLRLAVPAGSPLAAHDTVPVEDLTELAWIASPDSGAEPLLGVWPGLAGRPRVAHTARDWLTKLRLVAAGCGVTTVPASLVAAVPAGVRLLTVQGGPVERRRSVLARRPGQPSPPVRELARALHEAAAELV
ncbi:LysR family transcriptional regulator [Pseudonocardia humida]|uniref:LysR family transcriptional regulator n=1 Tax=Pseudonocardia humida TaxID=2800819 RepID=A0ABT0ZUU6_9PSEU|nr:LysR family transcriptional regulator [Pseudonocardia humida]MCO1654505.1 LysR family transcriptional regulator [Pseudonocardia humida]